MEGITGSTAEKRKTKNKAKRDHDQKSTWWQREEVVDQSTTSLQTWFQTHPETHVGHWATKYQYRCWCDEEI